jgi:hypothetical protein
MNQKKILKALLDPFFEVAMTYKKATFDVFPSVTKRQLLIQFYGSELVLETGKVTVEHNVSDSEALEKAKVKAQ